eukprot:tig00021517_g22004.t1
MLFVVQTPAATSSRAPVAIRIPSAATHALESARAPVPSSSHAAARQPSGHVASTFFGRQELGWAAASREFLAATLAVRQPAADSALGLAIEAAASRKRGKAREEKKKKSSSAPQAVSGGAPAADGALSLPERRAKAPKPKKQSKEQKKNEESLLKALLEDVTAAKGERLTKKQEQQREARRLINVSVVICSALFALVALSGGVHRAGDKVEEDASGAKKPAAEQPAKPAPAAPAAVEIPAVPAAPVSAPADISIDIPALP